MNHKEMNGKILKNKSSAERRGIQGLGKQFRAVIVFVSRG